MRNLRVVITDEEGTVVSDYTMNEAKRSIERDHPETVGKLDAYDVILEMVEDIEHDLKLEIRE